MKSETFSFSGSQFKDSYDPETRTLTIGTETGQFLEIQFDPQATRTMYESFLLAAKANNDPPGDDIELAVNWFLSASSACELHLSMVETINRWLKPNSPSVVEKRFPEAVKNESVSFF